ncbi:type IV pilin protein [Deinococcus ruber]|nr:type II secretion system protein [Deinococcus ruber]
MHRTCLNCRSPTSRQGFTLIEVLIVVAIIGILAAIVIPNLLANRQRPYDVAALQCGKAIIQAQVTYSAEHNNAAADDVARLGNTDVTAQCRGVEISEIDKLTIQDSDGDGNITTDDTGHYAFKVWHQHGHNTYVYNTWSNQHLTILN